MGSMSDVVEHTDVVCLPKRTLAEQAGKGRVLLPVNFFRLSEARLRNSLADKHSTACKARCSRGGYTTTFNKEPKFGFLLLFIQSSSRREYIPHILK